MTVLKVELSIVGSDGLGTGLEEPRPIVEQLNSKMGETGGKPLGPHGRDLED